MRKLVIIRHSLADDPSAAIKDSERKLTDAGRELATRMGLYLAKEGIMPGVIITSSAQRTLTTAKLIAGGSEYPLDAIVSEPALYNVDLPTVMKVINKINDNFECAFLVGHNPTFSDLLDYLTPTDVAPEILSPCTVAQLEFTCSHWYEVAKGDGHLNNYFAAESLPYE